MDLKLYEEIALLALDDETGKVKGDHPRVRMASAILAGLILRGGAKLSSNKKAVIALSPNGLDTDPLLVKVYNMIKEKGAEGYQISALLEHLSEKGGLVNTIAQGLCEKGILKAETQKVMFFFDVTRYPEADSRAEQALKQRLRDVISGSKPADERTTALIALANGDGLLKRNLGADFVKAHKSRIDAIVKGNDIAGAAKELVEALDCAMMMTIIMPTVVVMAAS